MSEETVSNYLQFWFASLLFSILFLVAGNFPVFVFFMATITGLQFLVYSMFVEDGDQSSNMIAGLGILFFTGVFGWIIYGLSVTHNIITTKVNNYTVTELPNADMVRIGEDYAVFRTISTHNHLKDHPVLTKEIHMNCYGGWVYTEVSVIPGEEAATLKNIDQVAGE